MNTPSPNRNETVTGETAGQHSTKKQSEESLRRTKDAVEYPSPVSDLAVRLSLFGSTDTDNIDAYAGLCNVLLEGSIRTIKAAVENGQNRLRSDIEIARLNNDTLVSVSIQSSIKDFYDSVDKILSALEGLSEVKKAAAEKELVSRVETFSRFLSSVDVQADLDRVLSQLRTATESIKVPNDH